MSALTRRRLFDAAAATGALAAAGSAAAQQPFPNRPIRFVIPTAAGSGIDSMTRIIIDSMARRTGQSFFIDNKPGGAGAIGARYAVTQPADGHTLFYGGPNYSILPVINQSFAKEMNVRTAFDPVTIAASGPYLMVVNPALPAKTLPDLVQWLRANPGKGNFAHSGVGATPHLLGELFARRVGGLDVTSVVYRGDALAMQAVASGEAHYTVTQSGTAMPLIQAGTVRPVATTGATRMKQLPDVPTVAETKVIPDFEFMAWLGYFVPGGTPPDAVRWLNKAIADSLQDPAVKAKLEQLGFEPEGSDPGALRAIVERDLQIWTRFVENGGLPKGMESQ